MILQEINADENLRNVPIGALLIAGCMLEDPEMQAIIKQPICVQIEKDHQVLPRQQVSDPKATNDNEEPANKKAKKETVEWTTDTNNDVLTAEQKKRIAQTSKKIGEKISIQYFHDRSCYPDGYMGYSDIHRRSNHSIASELILSLTPKQRDMLETLWQSYHIASPEWHFKASVGLRNLIHPYIEMSVFSDLKIKEFCIFRDLMKQCDLKQYATQDVAATIRKVAGDLRIYVLRLVHSTINNSTDLNGRDEPTIPSNNIDDTLLGICGDVNEPDSIVSYARPSWHAVDVHSDCISDASNTGADSLLSVTPNADNSLFSDHTVPMSRLETAIANEEWDCCKTVLLKIFAVTAPRSLAACMQFADDCTIDPQIAWWRKCLNALRQPLATMRYLRDRIVLRICGMVNEEGAGIFYMGDSISRCSKTFVREMPIQLMYATKTAVEFNTLLDCLTKTYNSQDAINALSKQRKSLLSSYQDAIYCVLLDNAKLILQASHTRKNPVSSICEAYYLLELHKQISRQWLISIDGYSNELKRVDYSDIGTLMLIDPSYHVSPHDSCLSVALWLHNDKFCKEILSQYKNLQGLDCDKLIWDRYRSIPSQISSDPERLIYDGIINITSAYDAYSMLHTDVALRIDFAIHLIQTLIDFACKQQRSYDSNYCDAMLERIDYCAALLEHIIPYLEKMGQGQRLNLDESGEVRSKCVNFAKTLDVNLTSDGKCLGIFNRLCAANIHLLWGDCPSRLEYVEAEAALHRQAAAVQVM